MKKDGYVYPAIFDYADDGIGIEFPDLSGCFSCAYTDEEALYMAREAMKGWILVSGDFNGEMPKPTPLKDVTLKSNQRVVLVDVCVAMHAKQMGSEIV